MSKGETAMSDYGKLHLQNIICVLKDIAQSTAFEALQKQAAAKNILWQYADISDALEGKFLSDPLYITDAAGTAKAFLDQGKAVVVYLHADNRSENFDGCRYAFEDPASIDIEYLERIYRRYHGIPWDILETSRCHLRETTVDDVAKFFRIYADKSICKYTEDLYPTMEEEIEYTKEYIANAYHFYEFGVWTIVHKETGKIIGRAGLSVREGFEEPELGYVLDTAYQGQGIALEVCSSILDYAKEYLGAETINALVHRENEASLRLLDKLGFCKTDFENDFQRSHADPMQDLYRKTLI